MPSGPITSCQIMGKQQKQWQTLFAWAPKSLWMVTVSMKLKDTCSLGEVSESSSVVSDSLPPYGLYSPWNSPGQNTGVGSLSLLQGIFSTQGLNPGLPHCRQIFYQLSHKGSPKVTLNWSLIESSISTKRKRKFLLNKAKTARVLNYNSGSRS